MWHIAFSEKQCIFPPSKKVLPTQVIDDICLVTEKGRGKKDKVRKKEREREKRVLLCKFCFPIII
jgi:hypothetical protein